MGCGASKKKEEETQDRDQQNDGQVKEKTDEGAAGAGDKSSSDMEDSNSSAMGDSNSSDIGDSNSSEMGDSNSSGVSDDASGDDDDKKNARKEKREAKSARKEERKAKREGKAARKEERKAKREGKAARKEERKEKREGKTARKEERRVKREGKAERKEERRKKREEKAAEEKAAEEKAAEEEKPSEEPKKEEEAAAGGEEGAAAGGAAVDAPAEAEKNEEEKPAVEKKDNSARKSMWDELREKLPTEKKNKEQRKARKALFNTFDPNGNGYLSVAECDLGFRSGDMKLDDLTDDLAPILMRAFNQAKGVRQAKGKGKKQGEDYVEKPEFRLLLVYLKQYFELWFMFDEIDSGDDRRVNQEEFNKAAPKLAEWGVAIDDSNDFNNDFNEAAFKEIDTNDGGIVLFTEFAEWAIKKGLEFEDADSSSEDKDD